MDCKKICILLPAVRNVPNGGYKIIYDYANRLTNENMVLNICYASYFPNVQKGYKYLVKCVLNYLYQQVYRKNVGCKWFNIDNNIKEKYVWKYTVSNIPKADIYIATAVTTAQYAYELKKFYKKKAYYFIQDYETFICNDEQFIADTYKLDMHKIVVSNWLSRLVSRISGQNCEVVVNGFNKQQYYLTIPIQQKKKTMISMLYHERAVKDIPTGLKALEIVKKKIPELTVRMYGVYNPPKNLPQWIHYTQNPTPEQHLQINNESAIYLGCSKSEGWGLTVGEAMMCGQAIVCTDNKGYLEMVQNNFNALVSPVGDSQSLADNIIKLITNDDLRYQIAQNGLVSIQKFDIENSYLKFKTIITK